MSPRVAPRGLTLLELLVVMVILVALAGILVPLLPGMLSRARVAEQSTNAAELLKAWQIFQATDADHHCPDGLDSLVDQAGEVYARLPGRDVAELFTVRSVSDLATDVSTATQTVTEAALVERIRNLGIQNLYVMDSATTDATFEPYGVAVANPTPVPVAASSNLVRCSTAVVAAKFNAPSDGVYVVLGIGQRSTIVGHGGIANAPVHAVDEANATPVERYSRYGVIYNLKPTPPQLVGIVAFRSSGIVTGDEALQEYYRLQSQ